VLIFTQDFEDKWPFIFLEKAKLGVKWFSYFLILWEKTVQCSTNLRCQIITVHKFSLWLLVF